MAIHVQCKGCNKKLVAKDEMAGMRLKCPSCGQAVVIAMPAAAPQFVSATPAPLQRVSGSKPHPTGPSPVSNVSKPEVGIARDSTGKRISNIIYGILATVASLIGGIFLLILLSGPKPNVLILGLGFLVVLGGIVEGGRHLIGGVRGTKVKSRKDTSPS